MADPLLRWKRKLSIKNVTEGIPYLFCCRLGIAGLWVLGLGIRQFCAKPRMDRYSLGRARAGFGGRIDLLRKVCPEETQGISLLMNRCTVKGIIIPVFILSILGY